MVCSREKIPAFAGTCNRERRSEVRSQRSEIRSRRSEVSPQDTAEPCPYTLVVACNLSFCDLLLKATGHSLFASRYGPYLSVGGRDTPRHEHGTGSCPEYVANAETGAKENHGLNMNSSPVPFPSKREGEVLCAGSRTPLSCQERGWG
jgi:hypothetical protein